MVSSGAIAEGMKRLGWPARPHGDARAAGRRGGRPDGPGAGLRSRRCASTACAPRRSCSPTTTSPTASATSTRARRSLTLLGLGVIPVINENDTVVTDEIRFGDNDTLGALVANLIEADVLVILTDQRGLYSRRPAQGPGRARCVDDGRRRRSRARAMAGGAGIALGRGGMLTKVLAAKRAARSGASTVIASGRERDVLLRLAAGEAHRHRAGRGDAEARRAQAVDGRSPAAARRGRSSTPAPSRKLRDGGKSLLPIGVVARRGRLPARRRDRRAHARAARRSRAASSTTAAPRRG